MPRKSVNPPRGSHISPTLALPGFGGFPSKSSYEAFGDGQTRPSPYGDLSLDIFMPAPTVIKSRLTNDQMWEHRRAPPKAGGQFEYPRKELPPGVYPQSKTSTQTGFASNADTILLPNHDPFPVMTGLLEAQLTAMKQQDAAQRAATATTGREAAPPEYRERMKSPAELYFEELRKHHDAGRIDRLMAAGYTEDEIAEHLRGERMRDMRHVAMRHEPEAAIEDVIQHLTDGLPRTGTNAVGIGALSLAQRHPAGPPTTTKQMLRQNARANNTGGSVAAAQVGGGDPRASASYAAKKEADGAAAGMAAAAKAFQAQFSVAVAPPAAKKKAAKKPAVVAKATIPITAFFDREFRRQMEE